MKNLKTLTLCTVALIAALAVQARTTDINVLPQAAQQTIKQHFGSVEIRQIEVHKAGKADAEYEVKFKNGAEIEFNAQGAWTEVQSYSHPVPNSLVPAPILSYVRQNFRGRHVTKIDIEKSYYEVKLSDGAELRFTLDGQFLKLHHN